MADRKLGKAKARSGCRKVLKQKVFIRLGIATANGSTISLLLVGADYYY